jgi:hypothetical protein
MGMVGGNEVEETLVPSNEDSPRGSSRGEVGIGGSMRGRCWHSLAYTN